MTNSVNLTEINKNHRAMLMGDFQVVQRLTADIGPEDKVTPGFERPAMEVLLAIAPHDSVMQEDIARTVFFLLVADENGEYTPKPMVTAEGNPEEMFFVCRGETSLSNFTWYVINESSRRFDELVTARNIANAPSNSEPATDVSPPVEGAPGLLGPIVWSEKRK